MQGGNGAKFEIERHCHLAVAPSGISAGVVHDARLFLLIHRSGDKKVGCNLNDSWGP